MTDNSQWAIGLMSGTSLDGIDAALIKTNGEVIDERGAWLTVEYDAAFRDDLSRATQRQGDLAIVERELTLRHADAVKKLLDKAGMKAGEISVIGFHGQTIDHRPKEGITWQLGNPSLLAAKTGIDVVADFRRRDMAEGGQGAPLVPLYHEALSRALPRPLAILNIGGIANVTYLGEKEVLAFDTGPGNGLMNRVVEKATGYAYDHEGMLAKSGHVNDRALDAYLGDPYFSKAPPKTLDRFDFSLEPVAKLSTADAVATLLEVTVQGIVKSESLLPKPPKKWLITGGGVHNPVLMSQLKDLLGNVWVAEDVGWESDALEAQAFGFLAVRSLRGLPLTLPQLTGSKTAVSGGGLYRA